MLIRATAELVSPVASSRESVSHHSVIQQALASSSFISRPQGVKGVPVSHGPEDALHDQLAGPETPGGDPAGGAVVPGGLDLRCVPEP